MSSPGLKMRFYKFRDNPPRLQYTRTPPRTPPSPAKSPSKNPPSPPRRNASLRQENPPKNRPSQAEHSPRLKAPLSNRLSFPKGVNPFDKGRESSPVAGNPPQIREKPHQLEPRPQARINFPRGVTLTLHGQGQGSPDRDQATTTQGGKPPQRFHQTSLGGARFPKGVGAIQQAPEQQVRVSSRGRFPKGVDPLLQTTENQEVRVYPSKVTSPKLETTFPAENTHPTRVALPRGASLPHQQTLHTPPQTHYRSPTTFPKGVEPFQEQSTPSYHPVESRTPPARVTLPKGAQLPQQVQDPYHDTKNAPTGTFPKGAVPSHQNHTQQHVERRTSPLARVTLPKGAYLPQEINQHPPEREASYLPPGRFPKGAEPFHQDHSHQQPIENRSPIARVTLPKGAHLPQQSQDPSEREGRCNHPLGRFPKGAEPFHRDHPLQAGYSQIEGDSDSRCERNHHQVSAQRESVPPRGVYLNFPKGVAPIQHRESENIPRAGNTLYYLGNSPCSRPTSRQTESIVHLNQSTDQNRETLPEEGNSTHQSPNKPQETVTLTRREGPTPDSSEEGIHYTQSSFSSTENQKPSQTTVTSFRDRGVILDQDQKPPPYSITTTRVTTNIGHKPPVAPRKSLEDLNQEFSLNRGNYLDKNTNQGPIGSPEGSVRSSTSAIRSPGKLPVRSGRSRLSGRFGSKSEPRLDRHACGSACTLTLYFSPSSPTSSRRRAYKSADNLCDSSNVYNSSNDDLQPTTATTTTARPTSSTARYIRTALSPIWFRISNSDPAPSSTLYNTSTRPISSEPTSSTGATRPYSRTVWRSEIAPRRPPRSLAQREVRQTQTFKNTNFIWPNVNETRSISVKCKPPASREYGLHKI